MSPSKQSLLDSIKPGMKLDKAFFLKAYGYEISFPGFADEAIKTLEDAGCSKARQYYISIVEEYETAHDAELAMALDKGQKGDEERRKMELMLKKKLLLMRKLQR